MNRISGFDLWNVTTYDGGEFYPRGASHTDRTSLNNLKGENQ